MSYNDKPKKIFQNIGSGVLWKNKYKKKETEPFFRGKATVRGHELELAAWIKKDKNGQDMISIAIDDPIEEEKSPHKRGRKETGLEELFGANDGTKVKKEKKLPFE